MIEWAVRVVRHTLVDNMPNVQTLMPGERFTFSRGPRLPDEGFVACLGQADELRFVCKAG